MGTLVPLPYTAPALARLARSTEAPSRFAARAVPRQTIDELFALLNVGPACADASPARYVFIASASGRRRLAQRLAPAQRAQAEAAPVCALVGYNTRLAEALVRAAPPIPGDAPSLARETAARNRAVQGAWLMIAARTLGLETAPIEGFDAAELTREFFPSGRVEAHFLCALGYPDPR